jgi:hypothetical protein
MNSANKFKPKTLAAAVRSTLLLAAHVSPYVEPRLISVIAPGKNRPIKARFFEGMNTAEIYEFNLFLTPNREG